MSRKTFTAAGATAVGPYSHAVEAGDLIFLSGQTPLDSATGKLVEGDIEAQTEQCFVNLFNVSAAAGLTEANVVKANVFLTDMGNFAEMNGAYAARFGDHRPARSTVQVGALPGNGRVEIEAIAKLPGA